jgi:hypothetical protein
MCDLARWLLARTRNAIFWGALAASTLALGGCSSTRTDTPVVNVSPEPQPPAPTLPAGPIKAAQIMQALSDRSFSYTRGGGRSGTVTFHADGTFNYSENGKGEGTGVWQASDGKLCEAFDPVSFMPKGTRSECRPFTVNGASYMAGDANFNPA